MDKLWEELQQLKNQKEFPDLLAQDKGEPETIRLIYNKHNHCQILKKKKIEEAQDITNDY